MRKAQTKLICLYINVFFSITISSVLYSSVNPIFINIVTAGLSMVISSYKCLMPAFFAVSFSSVPQKCLLCIPFHFPDN